MSYQQEMISRYLYGVEEDYPEITKEDFWKIIRDEDIVRNGQNIYSDSRALFPFSIIINKNKDGVYEVRQTGDMGQPGVPFLTKSEGRAYSCALKMLRSINDRF